ncbi:hypothetical protein A2U01_0100841, partial [Trifolium medium]|nr:hypothetical protein [Trifolium medium]
TGNIDSGTDVGVETGIIDDSDDSVTSDWLRIGTDSCLGSGTTDGSCARD